MNFHNQKLKLRSYIAVKVLFTNQRVELIVKINFAVGAIGLEDETFVDLVASLVISNISDVYHFHRVFIILLQVNKALTIVFLEYLNFADIFSPKLVAKMQEHIGINNHEMDFVDGKQPSYEPIYTLGAVELKILKNYIKTNLVNGFIRPSKSPVSCLIIFVQKLDISLYLYDDYQGPNNLTIENWYPLPLINESRDWLDLVIQLMHKFAKSMNEIQLFIPDIVISSIE